MLSLFFSLAFTLPLSISCYTERPLFFLSRSLAFSFLVTSAGTPPRTAPAPARPTAPTRRTSAGGGPPRPQASARPGRRASAGSGRTGPSAPVLPLLLAGFVPVALLLPRLLLLLLLLRLSSPCGAWAAAAAAAVVRPLLLLRLRRRSSSSSSAASSSPRKRLWRTQVWGRQNPRSCSRL